MDDEHEGDETVIFEAGAQEIPYPTAEVVNKKALAAGPIARANTEATPSLVAVATMTVTMPCYFIISRPWLRADAGMKINVEHPKQVPPPANQQEESKTGTFQVTVDGPFRDPAYSVIEISSTGDALAFTFQATIPLGATQKQVTAGILHSAFLATQTITEQYRKNELPPNWEDLTSFWAREGPP